MVGDLDINLTRIGAKEMSLSEKLRNGQSPHCRAELTFIGRVTSIRFGL